MKITIGIPMHNSAATVIETVFRAVASCEMLGIDYWILVVDDWSNPNAVAQVRQYIETNPKISLVRVADQFPETQVNPNLGLIVNACLDQVASDTDYYLNLESDVFLEPTTLKELLCGLDAVPDAPCVCPRQVTLGGQHDFIFWGSGIMPELPEMLQKMQRPKWCNLGCLLIRGDVARNRKARVDSSLFNLFCVDGDLTCTIAQLYGRPLYWPGAVVTHVGRQSTREGQIGGHTAHGAVARFDAKWTHYLAGGLFA